VNRRALLVSVALLVLCVSGSVAPGVRAHTVSCAGQTVGHNWHGTSGPDSIVGNDNGNEIDGLEGNDDIGGRGGRDYICGSEGGDTIRGEFGADVVFGGDGPDLIDLAGNSDDCRIEGGAASDLTVVPLLTTSKEALETIASVGTWATTTYTAMTTTIPSMTAMALITCSVTRATMSSSSALMRQQMLLKVLRCFPSVPATGRSTFAVACRAER
jgi:Ca2+-binding RTX toxin-like protein